MRKSQLTATRVRELLRYNKRTGQMHWSIARGCVRCGATAGFSSGCGHIDIRIDGRQYRIHRVIFLHVHGRWPADEIDHINGIPFDNRLCNLREASRSENGRNARRPTHNKSGIVGVFWNTEKRKWTAKIKVNQKTIYLGDFSNMKAAAAARKNAEREHGFSPTHGRNWR